MTLWSRFKPHLPNLATVWALLALGFGLLVRLRQYSLNLSLWLDEAMLALNIVGRNFGELLQPLDYDQGAPFGFLWVVKALVTVLGNRELTLRLLPFVAGCLSLWVFWRWARQVVGPVGVTFALLLLASSRSLIAYGAQVKQYALDVAITLLLYWLGLVLLRQPATRRATLLLALLGGLAIWFSHPAVFTLGGLGLTLILSAALKRDWKATLGYGLAAGFWLLNFAALYLLQYRNLGANRVLLDFWAEYFLPLDFSAPGWFVTQLVGFFPHLEAAGLGLPTLLSLGLLLVGVFSLLRRDQRWIWIFLFSLVLTLAASSLGKYPFGGRMAMFIVPGLLLCLGEGLEVVCNFLGDCRKTAGQTTGRLSAEQRSAHLGLVFTLVLAIYLAFPAISSALETALKPKMAEHIAPTLAYLKTNYREGDLIYLYHWSIPAFRYYAPKYGLETARVFAGSDFSASLDQYCPELTVQAAGQRTWLLFSHLTTAASLDERETLLDCAKQLGQKKREFSQPGTLIILYLYDLTGEK